MLTENLQPERETVLKHSQKPSYFLVQALRHCERAPLGSRKGLGCTATEALLQARLGSFNPFFLAGKCVDKIQMTDCQHFKSIAKIRVFASELWSFANIAEERAENRTMV